MFSLIYVVLSNDYDPETNNAGLLFSVCP